MYSQCGILCKQYFGNESCNNAFWFSNHRRLRQQPYRNLSYRICRFINHYGYLLTDLGVARKLHRQLGNTQTDDND